MRNRMNFQYFKIFAISFISMFLIMLPNIIENNGIYLYADDYFHQQIPFYIHATDTVNNLGIGWDCYTDLGTDFLTSYRSKKRFQ